MNIICCKVTVIWGKYKITVAAFYPCRILFDSEGTFLLMLQSLMIPLSGFEDYNPKSDCWDGKQPNSCATTVP